MVSAEVQQTACPVCKRTDKVKKLQTAYNEGVTRFAPPAMPGKTVPMIRYMLFSVFIVAVCAFLIIVFIGSGSFGSGFDLGELILVVVALVCIITALVLSYIAFTKVVQGDEEARKHYPEWDRAVAQWNGLRYCSRDDVVFDPQTGKVLSEEALASLMSSTMEHEKQVSQSSASLAHK